MFESEILNNNDTFENEILNDSNILEVEFEVAFPTASGIIDYERLENKPSINGVELIGNKTSSELKVQEQMHALTNLEIEQLLNGQI